MLPEDIDGAWDAWQLQFLNKSFLKALCLIGAKSLGSITTLCRPLGRGTDCTRIPNMPTMPLIQGCTQGLVTMSRQ